MNREHDIEIIEIKKVQPNGGDRRGFATVRVGELIIYDWRITQRQGGRAIVRIPQTSWRGSDGKIYYQPLLTIPAETQQRIEVAILAAWDKENTDVKQNAQE